MTATGQQTISDRAIQDARAAIVDVIGKYVALEKRGGNYFACCPFHTEKSPSFTVTESKEFFHCFGCGESGDAIDFVMKYDGLDFREAVEHIVGKAAAGAASFVPAPVKPRPEPAMRAIRTIPENTPAPSFWHGRLSKAGKLVKTWLYCDELGNQVGYVARFATTNKDGTPAKETLPHSWAVNTETGEQSWQWLSFAVPRTLYGAELLAQYPDRPVMVVEGEKATDATRLIFTGFVVVSWPGGSNAVDMANWPLLAGRDVVLWGDWDAKHYKNGDVVGDLMPDIEQPGTKAMARIYSHLRGNAKSVRFVKPMPGAPDGWDLADPAPCDGWDALAYARQNVVDAAEYFEAQARDAAEQQQAQDEPPQYDDQPPPPQATRSRKKQAAAAPEFPVPLDVFGTSAPPELPIELLPACFQDYVRDQSELLGCDPGIIGLGAIVSAATCIDDGIRLQPKRYDQTWTESARLWFAVVGKPSTKKSPAIAKAVRHVKRIDHGMADENQKAQGAYKGQLASWKDAKKADRNLPTPEPQPPANKRILVEDITVEALSDVLKDNPRGVLTLKDELTGWFASMDAYKGGAKGASMDRAHWLEAYNGGRRTIDRVSRGSMIVPNWSTSIIGGIQPDMIRSVSKGMGNDGLLQRFIVYSARDAVEDIDRTPDMDAMEDYRRVFDHLMNVGSSEVTHVKLSAGAHVCRERVAGYAKRLIGALDHAHIQAWLGKWDGLYARMLLVYHVLECMQRSVHPMNAEVRAETAAQVEQLLLSVLLPHAIHFYVEVIDANDKQTHVRQLARMVRVRCRERVTMRDMATQWKASRKLERWELRAVVENLATMGWLAPEMDSLDADGKPRSWFVNPAVHSMFEAHATQEAERRRAAVETLRELQDLYKKAAA